MTWRRALALGAAVLATTTGAAQEPAGPQEDPAVRAIVERFFAMQEAEDVEGYLALWSARAQKPRPEQLKFVFDAGDDRFSEIVFVAVRPAGDRLRVRVTVKRDRTDARLRGPDGAARVMSSRPMWSLTLVREGGEWRIFSEGVPADDLAVALIAAETVEARAALLSEEAELVNDRLLYALGRRADAFAQSQQFEPAIAVYERVREVAQRLNDRKAEGESLQNIGNARYFMRDFPAALRAYEDRLTLERASGNDAGAASALLGIATIRYSRFEYADALTSYREALALYERAADEAGMASALVSTGNVLYLQGDFDAAIADYRRSRDLHRKLFLTDGEARALEGLARVHTAQGDYGAALDALAGVREEARARGNRAMLATSAQSVGEVHFRLGNLDAARAAFDESRQHYEQVKDAAGTGRIWQALALVELSAGRFPQAEQGYEKSRAACTAAADKPCAARAIVGLAFALQSQERFDDAVATYGTAIAAFNALQRTDEAARAEVGLSQALAGRKDYAAAAAAAAAVIGRPLSSDVLWRAQLALARARRGLGEAAAALAAAGEAVSVVQAMTAESLRRPSIRLARDTAAPFTLVAVLQALSGDARAAFDTIEQRRAHELRLALATTERDISRRMTDAEREEERLAARNVGSLDAQLERERELPKPDAVRIAALESRLVQAIEQRADGQRRLLERWPELRVWRGLAPAITSRDVDALLPDAATIVLELVLDDHDLVAIVAARREDAVEFEAFVSPVTRQILAERIAEATRPATLRDTALWRAAAAALLEVIPRAAIEKLVSATRAIVVPDDVLWRVPVEALPHGDGYVADRTNVAYAASLSSLLTPDNLRSHPVPPPTGVESPAVTQVVAFAAPELAAERLAGLKATSPDWLVRPPEEAAREVRRIAEALPDGSDTTVSGAAATEGAFRSSAPTAGSLHLALPFRLNSASPVFSRLLVSSAGAAAGPADDAAVEVREIMNLELRAAVVVMSDGAALSMRDAASAAGILHWAWRAAGVPRVIVARWSAADDAAAELLAEFHARHSAGAEMAAALDQARATIRRRAGTGAPWFWAGWMPIGR